jgi:2'-5' RNA ligase
MPDGSARARPIAFCLVPAQVDYLRLSGVIGALARELDAQPFEPHVTLHVGQQTAQDDIEDLLAGVAASMEPIQLTARATGHTEALFKTLFIEFESDERPHALHRALRNGLVRRVDYELQPHLSLVYKVLPEAKRRELAARYDFRGQQLTFDHVVAVRPGGSKNDWMDIRGWETWLRKALVAKL